MPGIRRKSGQEIILSDSVLCRFSDAIVIDEEREAHYNPSGLLKPEWVTLPTNPA
jgi:hypothetical protein